MKSENMITAIGLVLALCAPTRTFAWGAKGHRIVAQIATDRLRPETAAAVQALLAQDDGKDKTLGGVSMWADVVRRGQRPETYNWHFVDIPLNATKYDPIRDCQLDPQKGDCAIAALERQRAILATARSARTTDRLEALKFITHLVGDIHQPLHASDNHDRGGNDVAVIWEHQTEAPRFHEPWNLHAVWDTGIIEQIGSDEHGLVAELESWLKTQDVAAIEAGTPTEWVELAHALAKPDVYRDPQTGGMIRSGADLEDPYFNANVDVVKQQLARAGVRLARMLNDTLSGPTAAPR